MEGARSKVRKDGFSTSIIDLPVRARQTDGLVGLYPQPRSPAKQLRAGAEALRRIAQVLEEGRAPILPEELRDVAAWLERGCLPE